MTHQELTKNLKKLLYVPHHSTQYPTIFYLIQCNKTKIRELFENIFISSNDMEICWTLPRLYKPYLNFSFRPYNVIGNNCLEMCVWISNAPVWLIKALPKIWNKYHMYPTTLPKIHPTKFPSIVWSRTRNTNSVWNHHHFCTYHDVEGGRDPLVQEISFTLH